MPTPADTEWCIASSAHLFIAQPLVGGGMFTNLFRPFSDAEED